MPELPEVETIRGKLEKFVVGHKIMEVKVHNRKIFPDEEKLLVGAKFKHIRRFGKLLVFDLDNGYSILSHIKMTGQFIYSGPNLKNPPELSKKVVGGVPSNHTHAIFTLDKKGFLYYNDVRRFGFIQIRETKDVENFGFIKKLGPEPLGALTLKHFSEILKKGRRAIKVVLMDQSKIGGVGNIYANDALWLSAIAPNRPASSLSDKETKLLYDAIEEVLKKGIAAGGSSEFSYVTPDGLEGSYQKQFLAYGKEGTKCPRCQKGLPAGRQGIFKKNMLGGRGTYFCPECQK